MIAGFRGTFVISWLQTEVDGLRTASADSLIVGATWQWNGSATRVDGPSDLLILSQCEETARLRQHAAQAVRRMVHMVVNEKAATKLPPPEEPLLESGFSVTDGMRHYTATVIDVPQRDHPLLMFIDDLPPEGAELWVTHVSEGLQRTNRSGDTAPQVICFTPGTRIATPDGDQLVNDLEEGDLVLTKDDGPQPIRWVGKRRISGARLFTMPELRPIRIRGGALGPEIPDGDLIVSPLHRMLLKGPQAQSLFGSDEVLVRARDLLNDHSVIIDHSLTQVTYVHLLLDRHQILFANGLESESFHPGTMDLNAVDPSQRDGLLERVPGMDKDPSVYGAFSRRMLNPAEAAIFLQNS